MFELYFRKINVVAVYWRGKEKGRMQEWHWKEEVRTYEAICKIQRNNENLKQCYVGGAACQRNCRNRTYGS